MKKRSREEILFKTVKEDNILPITSICKLNCIFCSHKNNPSEIETYSFGHLELDLIKTMIEFLDPERPVFIGESASKIIEGEPFVHPEIYQILEYLRQRWPDIEIKITTSASFINIEKVGTLKTLEPLELNISLNAPAPEERVFLMNDSKPNNVFKIIPELKQQLKFSASIVSMHHLKGFDYLKRTFDYLEQYPPLTLRVFMAGFSHYADPEIIADAAEYQKLNQFIKKIKNNYSYPIIIEPQLLSDFKAQINDIIKNSPAAKTDLKAGDVIKKVDQETVVSRVDAFYQIKEAKNPVVDVQRADQKKKILIEKKKNEASGLIMSYDLSRKVKNTLEAYAAESSKNKKGITVIMASEAGYDLLADLIKEYRMNNNEYLKLLKVKNEVFGASIIAAGLLTNSDLARSLKMIDGEIEKIILPEIIYDYYGNDLLGEHYTELEENFRAEVVLI